MAYTRASNHRLADPYLSVALVRWAPDFTLVINSFYASSLAYSSSVADSDMAKVRWLFDVNVLGHYSTTKTFIPLLIKSKRGLVMFNSSLASVVPLPYNAPYNAAKAALNAIGDTLRVELAPFGVKVVNVRVLSHDRSMKWRSSHLE